MEQPKDPTLSEKVKYGDQTNALPKKPGWKDFPPFKIFMIGFGVMMLLFCLIGVTIIIGPSGWKDLASAQKQRIYEKINNNSMYRNWKENSKKEVVSVNGKKLFYGEYFKNMTALRTFYKETFASGSGDPSLPASGIDEQSLKNQALTRMVELEILNQMAEQFNLKVTLEETNKAREDAKTQLVDSYGSEEAAVNEVKKVYGWTMDDFFINIVDTQAQRDKLQAAFDDNKVEIPADFDKEEVKARHIFVSTQSEDETQTEAQIDAVAKAEINKIVKRLQRGEDFAKIASEVNIDGTKENGGDLGWFSRGVMVPEFEEAVFAMKDGDVTWTPVKTSFGYHLIRRDESRTSKDFSKYFLDRMKNDDIQIKLKGVSLSLGA